MKNYSPFNRSIFILLLLIVIVHGYGQTGLNFQGVARTNNNIILASQPISLRLSILQGSASGIAEYVETRRVTTNAQGLFTAVIGDTGAISTLGNFTTINWRNTPKFLKIEMDPTAGTNFITMGTTQFQYVAYAQFANSVDAENITGVVPVARGGTGANSLSSFKTTLALDNVNNTTDLSKPISTATQTALDLKLNAADTLKYVKQTYADSALITKLKLVDTASMLSNRIGKDTLNLSARINLKANMSDLTTGLALKLNAIDTSKYTKQTYADSALLTKLKLSDTSSMLSNRIGKDTLNLSARINLKANSSDMTSGLLLKENASNKSTATDLGGISPSDILFPTQKAVKEYVTANASSGGVADGGITTIKLADGAVTDAKLGTGISKSKVGLGNVENISISTWSGTNSLTTVGTITSGVWSGTAVAIEKGGTGATTASAARTNLGLVIGTNVQAPLVAGTDYLVPTGSAASLTNFPTFNQNTTGNAATATTAGNITATSNTTLTTLSNLTSVGTITTGTWSGTAVAIEKGGTGLTSAGTAGQVLTSTGSGTLVWKSTTPLLSIGDVYQGGIVAYILQADDPGFDATIQKGIIAASSDQGSGIGWYNGSVASSTGATGTAIGTGSANTTAIITIQDGTPTSYAAGLARAHNGGGYTDWYLPSKDELNKLYLNRTAIGGFANDYYWSSTEISNTLAILKNFGFGNQENLGKSYPAYVRAIRAFSAVKSIEDGGTGATTQQTAINAITGTQISGRYLRSDGTNATLSTIQIGDVPTLNQNTTGNAATAGNITATVNTTLTSLSNLATVGTITTGVWSGTAVAVEKGGTGATTASAARTNLGLEIGTNVQAPLVAGTDYLAPTGSAASLTNFPTLNQNTTGNAATATTAGNITATTNTTLISLSNLATVGTITSGVWSGTAVAIAKGGTGLTSAGNNGQVLTSTGSGTLTWTTIDASTLSGTTLKSTITGSSLTSVGTIASLTTGAITNSGKVIVGASSAASASAVLEASSTTQGFLPPRMTKAQRDAIISPAAGLTIWNTTYVQLEVYNGSLWVNMNGTSDQVPTIGQYFQGGIVAYILVSGDPGYDANTQHGLIAATSDQSTGIQWSNGSFTTTGATGPAIGTGLSNTNTIISSQGPTATSYAAGLARAYKGGGYTDWYLPSKDELAKLYAMKLLGFGGFASNYYWSSTEHGASTDLAGTQNFGNGGQSYNNKSFTYYVRAIRAF
jgi:hypothetical protein